MSDERKPLWPWIVAMLIGLPVLYVASIRPACWLIKMEVLPLDTVAHAYRPIVRLRHIPEPIHRFVAWYAGKDQWGAEMLSVLAGRLAYEEQHGYGVP